MKNDTLKGVKLKHYLYAIAFELILGGIVFMILDALEGIDKKTIAIVLTVMFFVLLSAIPILIIIKKYDKYL